MIRSTLPRVLMGVLLFPAAALAAETAPLLRYVEGEVIVKFKRALGPTEMGAAARTGHAQASIARRMVDPATGRGDARVALSRFPRTTSVEAMIARLRAQPDVEYAEPNYVISLGQPKIGRHASDRSSVTRRVGVDANGRLVTRQVAASDMRSLAVTYPNDPSALDPIKGWGWLWVNADIVWPDAKAAEVAVVDTGVDAQHPELMGLVVNGFDFVNNDGIANDDNGHGTHVAGIIAAKSNNKTGMAGVSRARIYAIKVLAADGSGTYFDVAQGIRKAADRASVRIINVSLGGNDYSATLQAAVDYAVNAKGKLLVAAAGNESVANQPPVSAPFYPAAHSLDYPEKVLAVAASGLSVTGSLDGLDHFVENCRASYSNFGDYVNITAPGTDIYSTQPWKKDFYEHRYFGADSDLTGYEFYSGTSMAAPHVAAVAARVFGNNVKFTNLQVAHRLLVQGYSSSVGPTSNVDVDGDGTDEITECWESGFTPPTPLGMTPFLADVNAATALGRGPRHRPSHGRHHRPRLERRHRPAPEGHGDRGLRRPYRNCRLVVLRHHQRALERPGHGHPGPTLQDARAKGGLHLGNRRGLRRGRRAEAGHLPRLFRRRAQPPPGERAAPERELRVRHRLGHLGQRYLRGGHRARPVPVPAHSGGPSGRLRLHRRLRPLDRRLWRSGTDGLALDLPLGSLDA